MNETKRRGTLLLDAGNTSVLTGCFQDGELQVERVQASNVDRIPEVWKRHAPPETLPETALLASVHPTVEERLKSRLREVWNLTPKRFRIDVPCPIGVEVPASTGVGDDRLLNAAGAWIRYERTCIVVDCGTAVTFDVVRQGAFQGGVIAPGLEMGARALSNQTELIPDIPFDSVTDVIGKDTESAVRSGLTHGFTGMVRQILREIRSELDLEPLVVGVGGTLKSFDRLESEFDQMDPDLTLFGLLDAWKRS